MDHQTGSIPLSQSDTPSSHTSPLLALAVCILAALLVVLYVYRRKTRARLVDFIISYESPSMDILMFPSSSTHSVNHVADVHVRRSGHRPWAILHRALGRVPTLNEKPSRSFLFAVEEGCSKIEDAVRDVRSYHEVNVYDLLSGVILEPIRQILKTSVHAARQWIRDGAGKEGQPDFLLRDFDMPADHTVVLEVKPPHCPDMRILQI
jgi:hypothetical protein